MNVDRYKQILKEKIIIKNCIASITIQLKECFYWKVTFLFLQTQFHIKYFFY